MAGNGRGPPEARAASACRRRSSPPCAWRAKGSWWTSIAAVPSEDDSARLVLFPASRAAFLPDGAAPDAGHDPAPARPRVNARGDSGQRRRGVLSRPGGRSDRRRNGPRRWAHHAARIWPPTGPSGATRSRSPTAGYTIYSMPPASSGGVTMGEILNIMEGYSPAATVRLPRAAPSGGRSDAAGVHRPQHLPGRSGLRQNPWIACCRSRTPPRCGGDRRPGDGRRRPSTRHREAAARPRITPWWMPRATRSAARRRSTTATAARSPSPAPGFCSTMKWMISRRRPASRTCTAWCRARPTPSRPASGCCRR